MRERVTINSTMTIYGTLADISTSASAISQDTDPCDPRQDALEALREDCCRHMKSLEQTCRAATLGTAPNSPGQDAQTYRGTRNRILGNRVVREIPGAGETILEHPEHPDDEEEAPFTWGSPGPGTGQLATALLADATQDPEYARENTRKFRKEVVEKIHAEEWEMEGEEILGWVNDHP